MRRPVPSSFAEPGRLRTDGVRSAAAAPLLSSRRPPGDARGCEPGVSVGPRSSCLVSLQPGLFSLLLTRRVAKGLRGRLAEEFGLLAALPRRRKVVRAQVRLHRATVGSLAQRQDTAGSGSCSPRGSVGERADPFPPASCLCSRYCCFGKGARVLGVSQGKIPRVRIGQAKLARTQTRQVGCGPCGQPGRDGRLSPPAAELTWASSPWPAVSLGHGPSTSPCGLCCCLWA